MATPHPAYTRHLPPKGEGLVRAVWLREIHESPLRVCACAFGSPVQGELSTKLTEGLFFYFATIPPSRFACHLPRQVEAWLDLPDAGVHIILQVYTTVPPPRTTSPS